MKFEYDLPDLMQTKRYWIGDSIGYKKLRKIRGIYGLFNGGQLVYVGMSLDLWQRLQAHKVLAKDGEEPFTHYTLQEFKNATKARVFIYEAIYISYYQPPWNRGSGRGYLYK